MIKTLFKQFLNHRGGVALIEFALVFPVFFLLLFGGIEITRLILIQQKLEKSGYVIADIVSQYRPATQIPAAGQISVAELNSNVFPQLPRMMETYSVPARQSAILTALRISGPVATRTITIDWQATGGGTLSGTCDGLMPDTCAVSIVNGLAPASITNAVRGTTPTFPTAEGVAARAFINAMPSQLASTDYTLIVNEVFYFYRSLLGTLVRDVGVAGGTGFAGYNFFLNPKIYVKRTYFVPRIEGKLFHLPPTFPVP